MSRWLGAVALLVLVSSSLAMAQSAAAPSAASATVTVASPPPAGLPVVASPLMPGDTVTLSVVGEPLITGSYTIREDGRLVLPVAGHQQAAGLTPTELADRLTAALRPFVVNPVVSVTGLSGPPRTVSVVGDIPRPGTYDCRQACNINALMAVCGCTGSDMKGATLVRRGQLIPLTPEGQAQPQNMPLEPGDVVTLPNRGPAVVNVAGAVKTPSAIPAATCSSAGKALLLAGGPSPDGDPAAAYVLRGNQKLPVDLSGWANCEQACSPDLVLQAGDVVMVPPKKDASCYVLGEVKTPGAQTLRSPTRVSTALAQAGGTTAEADGQHSYILRGDKKMPLNLASLLTAVGGDGDAVLIAGDVVVVPKNTGLVYVLGQATKPGALPLASAPTALAAWSQAGPPTTDADLRNAMLLRGTQCQPLNLEALDRGDTRLDVPLQAGDRIMVPKFCKTMYVLGQVNKPGIYPIASGDTLLDMMAKAGGPTGMANCSGIAIVRKTPANCTPTVECPPCVKRGDLPADKVKKALECGLTIKFLELAKAQTCGPEVLAQPGDLLYVPALQARRLDWLQVLLTLGVALIVN